MQKIMVQCFGLAQPNRRRNDKNPTVNIPTVNDAIFPRSWQNSVTKLQAQRYGDLTGTIYDHVEAKRAVEAVWDCAEPVTVRRRTVNGALFASESDAPVRPPVSHRCSIQHLSRWAPPPLSGCHSSLGWHRLRLRHRRATCTGSAAAAFTCAPFFPFIPVTWAEKIVNFERKNSIVKQTEVLTRVTHVNGWFPSRLYVWVTRVKTFVCFTYRIFLSKRTIFSAHVTRVLGTPVWPRVTVLTPCAGVWIPRADGTRCFYLRVLMFGRRNKVSAAAPPSPRGCISDPGYMGRTKLKVQNGLIRYVKQTEVLTDVVKSCKRLVRSHLHYFMSHNFSLFQVSNLSVLKFRIFLPMYPGSVSGLVCGKTAAGSAGPAAVVSATWWCLLWWDNGAPPGPSLLVSQGQPVIHSISYITLSPQGDYLAPKSHSLSGSS